VNRKEKDRIKKKLLQEKKEILKKISEFRNEGKEIEPGIAQDVVDKAESSYAKEFLFELSDTEREILIQIDNALEKIEGDDFGICEMCHKEISSKRLNAVPWTPYCIKCQEKLEKKSQ
jgi:DnaK suppressor protein